MPCFINRSGELRIVSAFSESNGLILRSSQSSVSSLMHLDEGTVHKAKVPLGPTLSESQAKLPGILRLGNSMLRFASLGANIRVCLSLLSLDLSSGSPSPNPLTRRSRMN